MPKVLNKRTDLIPDNAVYVGRPSKWGNPFIVGRDGDRETVTILYACYLMNRHDLWNSLSELHGKDLVCWCAPEKCHADVLLLFANAREILNDVDNRSVE
jgi:hypothetical protein